MVKFRPSGRLLATAGLGVATAALLAWRAAHGGIPRHHLLHRADLPAISTAWDLLVVPVLAWFLLGRARARLEGASGWFGLGLGLLVGAGFALLFRLGHLEPLPWVLLAILAAGILAQTYRAECVLGFVLGMTFTFGAVLSSAVAGVLAGLSALLHTGARWLWRAVRSGAGR